MRSRAPDEPDTHAREILKRRAERLRAPSKTADELVEWVAEFRTGDERYAIPLASLRAVAPLRLVTPVPLSRPHVLGILRFGGQILTALSTSSLLGITGWSQDPAVLLVVDPGWGWLVALDCEEIPRPIGLPSRTLDEMRRGVKPVTEIMHDGNVVHIVNLARLLDRRTGARGG